MSVQTAAPEQLPSDPVPRHLTAPQGWLRPETHPASETQRCPTPRGLPVGDAAERPQGR